MTGKGRRTGFRLRAHLVAALALVSLTACVSGGDRPAPVPAPRTTGDNPWQPANTPPPARRDAPAAHRADLGINRPPPGLEATLHQLWRDFPGRTGIAVQRIDGDWALARRGEEYFPQQSVSKTWVALTLLSAVDAGRVRLTDRVTIGPQDLTLFHQPIATRVQREGSVTTTLGDLLELSITGSDNTANDSILRSIGGPDAVRRFIDSNRLGRIRFGPGERLLQSRIAGLDWQQRYSLGRAFQTARAALPVDVRRAAMDRYLADPEDGASPLAITAALARLARGDLLSDASTRLMLGTLARVTSGPQRLRAGVPAGWTVAHKTGTGQDLNGMATGYNDIGILTAPDGTRYAVAVMLANTTASVPERMQLMQAVSRAVATHHGT